MRKPLSGVLEHTPDDNDGDNDDGCFDNHNNHNNDNCNKEDR
jgi:hypothetical protein